MTLINLNPEFRHHSFRSGRKKNSTFYICKNRSKKFLKKNRSKKVEDIFAFACVFGAIS